MYGLVTLAATLVVAAISALIVVVAPRLEQHDSIRAAHGDTDHLAPRDDHPSRDRHHGRRNVSGSSPTDELDRPATSP